MKSELQTVQPIAYQVLSRSMKQNHLVHAYLFHGPKGTFKKDMALFLAKSLNCNKDEACEVCDTCRRIEEGTYSDVFYINGETSSIKKDEILKLQHELNKTALEENGRKVYIIDYMENATIEAQNALLKFIEEPANDRIAIFLVEQLDRVLPTIISRCQIVSFHPLPKKQCFEACKEKGMDELDAYLLSELNRSAHTCEKELKQDTYQLARNCFHDSMNQLFQSVDDALLILQLDGIGKKQKEEKKWIHELFVFYRMVFEDSLKKQVFCQDEWYLKQLAMIQSKQIDVASILQIIVESDDLLLRSVNTALLIDQFMYRIKEMLK